MIKHKYFKEFTFGGELLCMPACKSWLTLSVVTPSGAWTFKEVPFYYLPLNPGPGVFLGGIPSKYLQGLALISFQGLLRSDLPMLSRSECCILIN